MDQVLEMLKNQEQTRLRDREIDRKEQERLREDDRKAREDMARQIREGIKDEVKEVMKPWQERTEAVEQKAEDLQAGMSKLLGEVAHMKDKLTMLAAKPAEPSWAKVVQPGGALTGGSTSHLEEGQERNRGSNMVGDRWREKGGRQEAQEVSEPLENDEQVRIVCEKARRTIGFSRIGEDDIKRMYGEVMPYGGANTREEAVILSVKEFMHYELKIKPEEQEGMTIEELFERKSEELDTIYVRFKFWSSMSKIFDKVRILRKESQLVTYIPKKFQERFKALNDILKPLREEGEGWRTQVKMGRMDLIVSKKKTQMGAKYQDLKLDMTSLPQVCMTRPKTLVSGSPPLGRPGHREGGRGIGGKKRIRSGQFFGSSPTTKAPRKEVDKSDFSGTSGDESDKENMSNVTVRKKLISAVYCGPSTISSVKEGQGLMARPSIGEVTEVTGSAQGKLVSKTA